MSVNFSRILSGLAEFEPMHTAVMDADAVYRGVTLMPVLKQAMPGYIYVGKAASFTDSVFADSNACLIVSDPALDLSALHVNAAVFPEQTDVAALFQAVQRIFDSQNRLRDCSADILDALVAGRGIHGVLEVGLRVLGNPLLLSDSSSRLIDVVSEQEITDPAVRDIVVQGFSSQSFMSKFEIQRVLEKLEASSTPILLDSGFSRDTRRLVGKIVFQHKMIATLVMLETGRKFTGDDTDILNMLCEAVTIEMSTNKTYASYTGEIHENMMADLIEGKETPGAMRNKMRSLRWEMNQCFTVMAVLIPKINSAYSYMEYTRMRIKIVVPGSQIIYSEPYMVVLFSPKDAKDAARIRTALRELFAERHLVAGISLPFESVMDLKKHYLQAVRSIELGRMLKTQDALFAYDDFFIYDILSLVENKADLMDYYDHNLFALLQYDKANGTDYYETLYAYLRHGLNKMSTAKDLFIHRNTIDYRVQKISEITNLDLTNGENCFKLFMSFKIADMVKPTH